MAKNKNRKCYVGFWPWPRAWTSVEAYQLAENLKEKGSIHLKRALTEKEAKVFREVRSEYIEPNFEFQLCADGLILYRHNSIENDISTTNNKLSPTTDLASNDFRQAMRASSAGYRHYIPAMNIFFMLLESEMHGHGRNNTLYWIKPITKNNMVRVKNDLVADQNSSLTSFGEVTEMHLQRFVGEVSVGARIDGMFHQDVIDAFNDACQIYSMVFNDSDLWNLMEKLSSSWVSMQTELFESSLALSWSIIERDLVSQLRTLLSSIPSGSLMKLHNNVPTSMSSIEETGLRNKITAGDSPMAGKMISILNAHSISLHGKLNNVKQIRNNQQHSGASVTFNNCVDALEICIEVAKRVHNLELNFRLQPNAHLGITN